MVSDSPEEEGQLECSELKKVCVDKALACSGSEKVGEEEAEKNKGKLSKLVNSPLSILVLPTSQCTYMHRFRISKATRKILKEKGIKFLFPIQYLTFDHIYDGENVIGQARKYILLL